MHGSHIESLAESPESLNLKLRLKMFSEYEFPKSESQSKVEVSN